MIGKKKNTSDINSRQAVLWMHPSTLLTMMISERWIIVDNHLPEDVKFHHTFWDPQKQVFGIVCTSKEFKPVMIGDSLPELPQVSLKYYNPSKDGIIE